MRNGTETATCIRCSEQDTREEQKSALGHTFEVYTPNGDATCVKNGTETAQCIRCEQQNTREIKDSALGHDYMPSGAKEATCSEAGYRACQACRRCNNIMVSDKDYLPALHMQYQLENGTYIVTGLSDDCMDAEIVIPSSYRGKPVVSIGTEAFKDYNWINTIIISDGVTSIGRGAFSGCSGLQSVEIPDSITAIGEEAFTSTPIYNDNNNWDQATVLYIGNHLIKAKTRVADGYNIRENTKTIADGAFKNCAVKGRLKIPNGVTSIGKYAFYLCIGLTSLDVPNGVTSIGDYALAGCTALAFFDIPSSVTSIGNYALAKCTRLTVLDIPSGVTSIGDYAFNGIRDTIKNQKNLLKWSLSRA